MKTKNKHTEMHKNHDKVQLEWKTPEFIVYHRGKVWYTVAFLIALSLISYAVITNSISMAIVFVLITGLLIVTHRQKPRNINVQITDLGIKYDKKFYPYNQINAYWVVYDPPYVRVLYLRLGSKNYNYLKIELNHQNPVEVKKILSKEIPELLDMEERGYDILVRLLRL